MEAKDINKEYFKLKSDIVRKATLKECFLHDHPDECSSKIVSAHSLQKMGALTAIEGEVDGNMSVYPLTDKYINPESETMDLKPDGKKRASTFYGFCGKHDNELFKPFEENPNEMDIDIDEHLFLLSFRAFAISYHRKKESINLFENANYETKKQLIAYFGNSQLDEQLHGLKLGLQDMEPQKKLLIKAWENKDYSEFDFFAYEVHHTVPVAVAMGTSPAYQFDGTEMNMSADPDFVYSDILTSVIPMKERSIIVLAAFKSDPHGSKYLDLLHDMKDLAVEKALTWHLLTSAENCFFAPKWFDSLSSGERQILVKLSEFVGSVNTPYLNYNKSKFRLNLFNSSIAV
jgi:hypothetical protein